ncbi:MAG: hypothetical protein AAF602_23850 [Myxococcota bacterium]
MSLASDTFARVNRTTHRDLAAVRLVLKAAHVDLRLAVWSVWHAAGPTYRAKVAGALDVEDFVCSGGPWPADYSRQRWMTDAYLTGALRYGLLLRQLRPLRVAPRTLTRMLTCRPTLAVAWDRMMDGYGASPDRATRVDLVTAASRRWRRRTRGSLLRLTDWLQHHEPDVGWTTHRVWGDPVARMLCERSTLEELVP